MPNQLHTLPLKVEAFLSSRRVRSMQLDELGSFILILMESWLDGGSIPASEVREILGIRSDAEENWTRIKKNVIDRMFSVKEGRLVNSKLAEVYSETISRIERFSQGGKIGNQKRWGSRGSKREIAKPSLPDCQVIASNTKFKPPTVEEVKAHAPLIDAEKFCAFYESKGWKVGNQAMKSWKAATITWGKGGKTANPSTVLRTDTDYENHF